ncbi:MAG: zinc ribbon domain-containing protein [Opitutaceae bacterium]|jgi:predicted nucleic acid-binding Zn ribbon protein|nr:zinc ribbon domain-containing protein [Opitutaceae bacterium]
MATYIYETIPQKSGQKPVCFEASQSMKDKPLTRHPRTGEPVRRVITGGFGFYGVSDGDSPSGDGGCFGGNCENAVVNGGHCCGPGCGCGS